MHETSLEPAGDRGVRLTLNIALTKACNYQCIFCFARFPWCQQTEMEEAVCYQILENARPCIDKITFYGGEPTLVKYLPEALRHAKSLGYRTSLVTNASSITNTWLEDNSEYLDLLAVSIDSFDERIERRLGRGRGYHVQPGIKTIHAAHASGIEVKLNTVVTKLNHQEYVASSVLDLPIGRWKVFRVLILNGENDAAQGLEVTATQFAAYVERNAAANPIVEDNRDMLDTYLMVDPDGYIFQNHGGTYQRGLRAVEAPFQDVLASVRFDVDRFIGRGGDYNIAK